MTVTYLETHSQDPAYNLAFEEFVLQNRRQGDYLLLWQNDNTIVVGQNQNTEEEIDPAFVAAHRIRVVRRSTGGGAVYHDLGNLNYSFITDAHGGAVSFRRFAGPVVQALRGLGLEAEASGRNDILVSGRKVSGTAQRKQGDRVLHHGTLLFDSDPALLAGALRPDPEKFRCKSTKSVRNRVGNIRDFLPRDMSMAQFWAYLKEALAGDGLTEGHLTEEELQAVQRLKAEKYDRWEWNYGRSPDFDLCRRRYWEGGALEVCLSVSEGRITAAQFRGDFLSVRDLTPLTRALEGCPFRRDAVAALLTRYPAEELFGSITAEQVLHTMFDC